MLRHLDGCVLEPIPGKAGIPQILQLKLTPEMLQQLLHSKGSEATISFDKDMEICIGDNRHGFSMTPESSKIDVYRRHKHIKPDSLEHIGSVRQRIVVRRQLGNNISEKLKSRQAEEAAAKHERSVQTLEFDPKLKKTKNTSLSRASTPLPSRPDSPSRKSPFLQARKSPLLVASNPRTQTISLRTRVVQSLALGVISEQEIALKLKVPSDAISQVLADMAQKVGDNWVLADEHYQGLKVWDWKGYTSAERSAVISRASEAYERLGLSDKDPSRLKLIHPEKRKSDERLDTSPLSLNPPISVSPRPSDVIEVTSKSNIPGPQSATSEKKSSARGILTTGKVPMDKKRKVESATNISPPKPSKLRNTIASESKTQNTISTNASSKKSLDVPKPSLQRPESASKFLTRSSTLTQTPHDQEGKLYKEPTTSHKKLQASMDETSRQNDEHAANKLSVSFAKSKKQTSGSASKTSEPTDRSQTAYAESAKLAPSRRSPVLMDDSFDDRTASITSSSTVSTDRTTGSVSTVPTSVSSPPAPTVKARSKFLTSKKDSNKSLVVKKTGISTTKSDNAAQTQNHKREQSLNTEKSPSSQKQAELPDTTSRKRKAEDETNTRHIEDHPRKRMQSIDLQNMARDYKRFYPEYKELHAEVATKIGDPSLLTKFMEMHNQMSLWKQTLFAAEKDYN